MVDIYALVNVALDTSNLSYYQGMPEFGVDEEPETYLTYEEGNRPKFFGDGKRAKREYTITVNIISPFVSFELKETVISALEANGFCYINGGKIGTDSGSPPKEQYYQEFKIDLKE